MNHSIASVITVAVTRAALVIFGGIALCTSVLGAIGFALVALYSFLIPTLGAAGAAFAVSGAALAIPVAILAAVLIATRTWITGELPVGPTAVFTDHETSTPVLGSTLDWISEHPRSATLGALSFGIAFGAYPDLRKTILGGVEAALAQHHVPQDRAPAA